MSTSLRWTFRIVCCSLVLALGASNATAQTLSGGGQLSGGEKFAVTGCGGAKGSVTAAVAAESDGTWSTLVDGSLPYSGTYTPIGASGRKFDLDFDGASLATLAAVAEGAASDMCDASVITTSATEKKFTLKLNKRRTKAKIVVKYLFTGTAGGASGKARYTFKVKGPWGP